jgi:hypothetical protein
MTTTTSNPQARFIPVIPGGPTGQVSIRIIRPAGLLPMVFGPSATLSASAPTPS